MDYPKMLYRSGWEDVSDHVVVENEEEEAMAREDGYGDLEPETIAEVEEQEDSEE